MRLILILITFFNFNIAYAQNWSNVGSVNNFYNNVYNPLNFYYDSTDFKLYAVGRFGTGNTSDTIKGCTFWDGNYWHSMKEGVQNTSQLTPTRCIAKYKNKVYVGGAFNVAGGNDFSDGLAAWNGNGWETFDKAGDIRSLKVINDTLYALGSNYINTTYAPHIAKFDGNNWSWFPCPEGYFFYVTNIEYYNNEFYVSGEGMLDTTTNQYRDYLCVYHNNKWIDVLPLLNGTVKTMCVFQNHLYVAGKFKPQDGNAGYNIQKWDGIQWSDVGGGIVGNNDSDAYVNQIKVIDDKLYAVGNFKKAGGVIANNLAVWDGTNWCGFATEFDNELRCIEKYDTSFVIGGQHNTANGLNVNPVAMWIGGSNLTPCGNNSGQEDITQKGVFKLYPNPSTTEVSLSLLITGTKDIDLRVYDIVGKLIESKSYQNVSNHFDETINMGKFTSGVYMVSVQVENQFYTAKIAKQ